MRTEKGENTSIQLSKIKIMSKIQLLSCGILLIIAFASEAASNSFANTQQGRNSRITNEDMKVQDELQEIKEELKETRSVLSELIITLLNIKDDSGNTEQSGYGSVRNRREVSDDNDEDILSQLPISTLLGLGGRDGRDGKDGAPGEAGRDGRDGKDGVPGNDGIHGEKGEHGDSGSNGLTGPSGVPGQPGQEGRPGPQGGSGKDGAAGQPGEKGAPGGTFENLGTVYTRWGRTTCGNQSTRVYSGFTAGSCHHQTGGGVNYQCMPLTPEYNSYSSGGVYSTLSGAEYQSFTDGLFPNQAYDTNVPCARCYTDTRPAVMMLPAKRNCPSGWTKEYEGYLMTDHHTHAHPTTFECVDAHPEYITGSVADVNGALFYFVKPICSGTGDTGHCSSYQYINDRQLTCVVCSK